MPAGWRQSSVGSSTPAAELPTVVTTKTTWDNGRRYPGEDFDFRVDLVVGESTVSCGSHSRSSHSCDGWVRDLGVVDDSSIFGLIRGTGVFTVVLPVFDLVSRIQIAQQYRDNDHFLNTVSSSRHETMVVRALTRTSPFKCRFGCQWGYHRVWIVHSPIGFVDLLVDLIFISRYF
jgi:hypothetical protein